MKKIFIVAMLMLLIPVSGFAADGDRVIEGRTADSISTVDLDVTSVTDGNILKMGASGVEDSALSDVGSGVVAYDGSRSITDMYHLTDKRYVDEAVTALGARYYMLNTASGESDYKLCSASVSGGGEQSVSGASLSDDDYVQGWIAPNTNEPDKLLLGVYNWRIYAEKTGGTETLRLYWKLVERKNDDSEVVIATSVVSNEVTSGKNSYIIPLTLSADHDIASDSYVVGKIYADVSGSGSAPSVTLYYEGDSHSHWQIPVNTEIFNNIYVNVAGDTMTGGLVVPTVDTGQGANELYDMDQDMLTSSSPTFAGVTLTNDSKINDDKKLYFGTDSDFSIEYDEDGDDVASFDGADINMNGYYTIRQQNIADLASKGPSYWFDGVDDYVRVTDNADLNMGTNDFSFIVYALTYGVPSTDGTLIRKGSAGARYYIEIDTDGTVDTQIYDGTHDVFPTYTESIIGKNTCIGLVADRSANAELYIDGNLVDSVDMTSVGSIDNTVDFNVGFEPNQSFNGSISRILLFNLALSEDEVKYFSSGGEVPYKYQEASQDELMPNQVDRDFSGASAWANVDLNAYDETTDLTITATAADQYCTLPVASAPTTIGKRYRMTFDVANIVSTWTVQSFDGTQTIGTISANGTGQSIEWTATTTGGYRLVAAADNSSGDFDNFTLTQIGCVLQLEPDGITPTTWVDNSGNGLDGSVSGALATNLPQMQAVMAESEQAEMQVTVFDSTESTSPTISTRKADGSLASPALVDDNAVLGRWSGYGYLGTNGWTEGARIEFRADGTPSDSANDMPTGVYIFTTEDDGSGLAPAVAINDSGNVGIGTTNPGARIEVYKTDGIPELRLTTDGTGLASQIKFFDGTTEIAAIKSGIIGNKHLTFQTDNTDALIIQKDQDVIIDNGNIGIGTTEPDKKLEINTGAATNGIRLSYNDGDGSASTYGDILLDSSGVLTLSSTGGVAVARLTPVTKTDDYTVTTSDFGKSLRMNSADDKTFTLPSVGSSDDGARVTFIKQGSGKMTIDAADSDYIDDSTAGGTIYTTTNYATITLEYVHGMTRWVIISGNGTFTTT